MCWWRSLATRCLCKNKVWMVKDLALPEMIKREFAELLPLEASMFKGWEEKKNPERDAWKWWVCTMQRVAWSRDNSASFMVATSDGVREAVLLGAADLTWSATCRVLELGTVGLGRKQLLLTNGFLPFYLHFFFFDFLKKILFYLFEEQSDKGSKEKGNGK